jgi:hypothetical protein
VCPNDTTVEIQFTGSLGVPGYTFDYTVNGTPLSITSIGDAITFDFDISTPGIYDIELVGVTESIIASCNQIITGETIRIEVLAPPTLVITNPDDICENDTTDLTLPAITSGSDSGLTYTYWNDFLASDPIADAKSVGSGTYYIKAAFSTSPACYTIKEVVVTEVALPEVTLADVTTCEGDTATITAIPTITGSYIYNWTVLPTGVSNPGNVASFSTTIAGDYKVEITDQALPNCISLTATGTVTISPLPTAIISIIPSADNTCKDSSKVLEITFTGADGTAPYTFEYNINGGTSQTITSTTGTSVTLIVPTNVAGVFNYNLLGVTDSSATACNQVQTGIATITIHDLPIVDAGPGIIEVCSGEEVTLAGSGADTYTWDNGVLDGIPFVPVFSGIYTVIGIDLNGCENTDQVEIIIKPAITGTISGFNDLEACLDPSNSTPVEITFTGANGIAPYTFTYDITSVNSTTTISNSVTSTGDDAIILIPTAAADAYTITLISVEDSSAIPCGNTDIVFPAQAFVTVYNSAIDPLNASDVVQTVCEGYPIIPIEFTILAAPTGTPTGAYADGLPNDVIGIYDDISGIFTISGTPTIPGTYSYTVQTIASIAGCTNSFNGTIEVTEGGEISIVDSETANQTSCLETAIDPIVYNIGGTATSAVVSFTGNAPDGISYVVTGNTVTISGTSTETGIFNYTITTVSTLNSCDQSTLTGTITIDDSEINLVSGDPSPTLCLNSTLIDPIVYAITSTFGATMELTGVLPIGLIFDPVTGEITGTPEESGSFAYVISASSGCGTPLSGTITVTNNPLGIGIAELPVGASTIEVCEGQEITLTGTGADTYVWDNGITNGVSFLPPQNTPTIYTVTGTNLNGCNGTISVEIIINSLPTASITGLNVFNVCINSVEPEITFTGASGVAPYTFTYSISSQNAINSGTPDPITYTVISAGNTATVPIVTNLEDVYTVQLISVEDSSSTNCINTNILEPSVATITVLESGIEPQAGTPIYQTVCENTIIDPITLNITNSATGAFVEGLPIGVIGTFTPNTGLPGGVFVISGTATSYGVFDYVVTTSGLDVTCNATFTGTITVNQDGILTLLTPASNTQSLCIGGTIEPIKYKIEGGATGANVTDLPLGLTWSIVGDILTISGDVNAVANDYVYTIITQDVCGNGTATGTITIIDPASVALTSAAGTSDQEVCINEALTTVKFQGNTGQTLILNGVLPPGVTFSVDTLNPHIATIEGTPTLSGTYIYGITTENSCTEVFNGSILVNDSDFINYDSGDLNQTACIGTPIEVLKYIVPISTTDTDITFTPASLPAGLAYTVIEGVLRIAGTPEAVLSETNYEISTNNGCGLAKATFKLTFEESPVITLETDSGALTQQVCQNGEIEPIKFTISGSATGIDENLLPSFITPNFDTSTGVYTLSGAPIYTGTFNFKIKTVGGSCSDELDVKITNSYAAFSIVLNSPTETDNQTICSMSTPIDDIVYEITGIITNPSLINVTGLPGGVTAIPTITTTGAILTISGQPTVSGIYEYGIEYNNCGGAIKTGFLNISSPATISAEVTQISCDGNLGEIAVTIFGGVPFIDGSGNPFYDIRWTEQNSEFRQNQSTITGLDPGVYEFSGFDALGCPLPIEVFTITEIEPLAVSLLSITSQDCNTSCVNFDFTGGRGIYTSFLLENYDSSSQSWNEVTGVLNYFNICDLQIGLYRLRVTDSKGCVSEPYPFTIDSKSALSIEYVSVDENLCNNLSGLLYVKMNSLDTDLNFFYNDVSIADTYLGDDIYELVINETGLNGDLKVVNSQGCAADPYLLSTQTIDAANLNFEFTSFDFENYGYFPVNSSVEFTNLLPLSIYNAIDYNYIIWDFGDNTPFKVFTNPEDKVMNPETGENIETVFHTYTNDGIYEVTLTVYNSAGCSTSITKTIFIGKGATIMLPTVFSPNYDGINDFFGPSFNGITELSMYIYDSWGNLVFEAPNLDVTAKSNMGDLGWDGIEPVNSEPKNEAYRCYIIAKSIDGKTIEKTGRFLIVQ